MSNKAEVLKQGTAIVLAGGTKVRIAIHSEGDRVITESEVKYIAFTVARTLSDPEGGWVLEPEEGKQ